MSKNNIEIQKRLFEEIQKNLPAGHGLVEEISDVLNVSSQWAYRRIRCETQLGIEEICTLCKHFNISFDMLMGVKNINQLDCIYRPLTLSVPYPDEYYNYMLSLSKNFERLRNANDSNILMSAVDIPLFHLLSNKELTFFKLYVWSHSVYNYEGSFDNFMKEIETPEIIRCHQKICNDYEFIPSSEIWTEKTIDTILSTINYYIETYKFSNKDLPLTLCKQILDILDKLQKWAENGAKGDNKTLFQFYLSEINFENSYIILKQPELSKCIVKLFTMNSLNVLDKDFCKETENRLKKLSKQAILLYGNAEKERIKFFNSQRQKVQLLMEKIKKSF